MMSVSRRQDLACSRITTRIGINRLKGFWGAFSKSSAGTELVSKPLRENLPCYLRPFRAARELPLMEQALLPMRLDFLPRFHARFGENGAALSAGSGHFLFWVALPDVGEQAFELVREAAEPWPILETALRWATLIPPESSYSFIPSRG